MADNHLVDIEGASALEYLISLNAQSNFISLVPASLERKKYLQSINLAKNKLKDFNLTNLPLLSSLNLNGIPST